MTEEEKTKAGFREWIVKNCILTHLPVEKVVDKMYSNLQEIGKKLMSGKTTSTGPK